MVMETKKDQVQGCTCDIKKHEFRKNTQVHATISAIYVMQGLAQEQDRLNQEQMRLNLQQKQLEQKRQELSKQQQAVYKQKIKELKEQIKNQENQIKNIEKHHDIKIKEKKDDYTETEKRYAFHQICVDF